MVQKDKELLLKDLCARLPYGVKCEIDEERKVGTLFQINACSVSINEDCFDHLVINCKPYLFPLSSMTEEQKVEFGKMAELDTEYIITQIKNDAPNWTSGLSRFNWLLKNHFDVYGLIPMGLALDATGKNIY